MGDTADSFASKAIPGLLRSAPDLTPNIKHVKSMYQTPEDSECSCIRIHRSIHLMRHLDSDELVPEDGKDEVYDNIMSEINDLEEELKAELKKIQKATGYT